MKIAHTALYTEKLEQTAAFYQDVFGAQVMGFLDTGRRGCWLSIGGDILEIFESAPMSDGCFKHIAISCSDLENTLNKAIAHGAKGYVMPKELHLPFKTPVHAKIAFIKGIAGEQIELWQPL